MKNSIIKQWPTIFGTLLVCMVSGWFFVRGIDFGLPDLFHDDEHFIVEKAVAVASGSPHLTWFDWPASSLIYLNASAFVWINLAHNIINSTPQLSPEQWFAADHVDFYLVSRMMTVLFAFGVLALTFFLGRAWKNVRIGLAAAALTGVSVILTRHAHYVTPDVPLTFFMLLAALAGLRLGETGEKRWVTLGAIAVGVGAMTKYMAVFALAPLILGYYRAFGWSLRKGHILHFCIITLIAITAASPFVWIELPTVWQSIANVSGVEHVGRTSLSFFERIRFYIFSLGTGVGNAVLVLSGAGMILLGLRRQRKDLLIIFTTLTYFFGITMLGITWERWILPVAPFIALLAAALLTDTLERFVKLRRARGLAFAALVILLMLPSFTRSLIVTEIFAANENDTRFQARAWVEKNLSDGTRIAQEKQTPRLSTRRYKTMTSQYLSNYSLEEYESLDIEYVIVSDEMYGRFFANDQEEYADERAFYTTLFETRERIYHAEGDESGFRGIIGRNDFEVIQWLFTESFTLQTITTGPAISIYKL